jgi:DNA repair exonuclease SbcCD ATPase subunit
MIDRLVTPSGSTRHCIRAVSIFGGFLDGVSVDFTEGLNCVIGARGTGKTTVLEFVRFALDALPAEAAARKRIESLVEKNLAGGRVEVSIRTRDGLTYTVSRSPGDDPVILDERRTPRTSACGAADCSNWTSSARTRSRRSPTRPTPSSI